MNREPAEMVSGAAQLSDPTRRRSDAFTLIELLVVIAVIALLVSILMPSLKQAKELARQAVCMSNQRQIALALNYYANDDEGGHYPPSPGWLNASLSFNVYHDQASGGIGFEDGWFGLGMLFATDMLDSERVLYCPSQSVPWFTYPEAWKIITGSGGLRRTASYYYRLFGQMKGGIAWEQIDEWHKISIWNAPARFALSADIFGHIGAETWVHLQPLGLGIAFGDGHAEFKEIPYEEYLRCIYYNNTIGENTGGPYQGGGIRDPFVYDFWRAIDSNSFAYLRQRWPLP